MLGKGSGRDADPPTGFGGGRRPPQTIVEDDPLKALSKDLPLHCKAIYRFGRVRKYWESFWKCSARIRNEKLLTPSEIKPPEFSSITTYIVGFE